MMPAGKYYVGDLCYVMHERWDDFCDKTIDGNSCKDGEMMLSDGTRFATYGTAYGDGTYLDNKGRSYSVDAGLIGCVLVSDLNLEAKDNDVLLGQVIEFARPFRTGVTRNGMIWFDNVEIDTSGEFYDEDED